MRGLWKLAEEIGDRSQRIHDSYLKYFSTLTCAIDENILALGCGVSAGLYFSSAISKVVTMSNLGDLA